jgi:hypothetical protein
MRYFLRCRNWYAEPMGCGGFAGPATGERGWGEKVMAIWRWKNELPAIYPEEIFYGKIPTGHAALMSMDLSADGALSEVSSSPE